MRQVCEGVYCVDCPLLQLESDEFTDQDRMDALNSVILLKTQFSEGRDRRFNEWEARKLEFEARQIVQYSNELVGRVAVRALERQVTGTCELLKRGEQNG